MTTQTTIEILKKCCIPGLEGYGDVNSNAIDFASTHLAELDLSELRTLDPKQGHHIACELLLRYQSVKKTGSPGTAAHVPVAPAPAATPVSPPPSSTSSSNIKKDKKK